MEKLKDSSGNLCRVNEGESALVVATLYDLSGDPLNKNAIITLTMDLRSAKTKETIRAESIRDANGGTLAEDGTLTLKLGPTDNVVPADSKDSIEVNQLVLTWTWTDPEAVTQTGRQEWEIDVVRNLRPSW